MSVPMYCWACLHTHKPVQLHFPSSLGFIYGQQLFLSLNYQYFILKHKENSQPGLLYTIIKFTWPVRGETPRIFLLADFPLKHKACISFNCDKRKWVDNDINCRSTQKENYSKFGIQEALNKLILSCTVFSPSLLPHLYRCEKNQNLIHTSPNIYLGTKAVRIYSFSSKRDNSVTTQPRGTQDGIPQHPTRKVKNHCHHQHPISSSELITALL